jgi:hypothetical protein
MNMLVFGRNRLAALLRSPFRRRAAVLAPAHPTYPLAAEPRRDADATQSQKRVLAQFEAPSPCLFRCQGLLRISTVSHPRPFYYPLGNATRVSRTVFGDEGTIEFGFPPFTAEERTHVIYGVVLDDYGYVLGASLFTAGPQMLNANEHITLDHTIRVQSLPFPSDGPSFPWGAAKP